MKWLHGSIAYRTKADVDVIPSDGDIVILADNKFGIYHYERSKKKKLKTPCKFPEKKHQLFPHKNVLLTWTKNMKI